MTNEIAIFIQDVVKEQMNEISNFYVDASQKVVYSIENFQELVNSSWGWHGANITEE